jgi:hypothetical protein
MNGCLYHTISLHGDIVTQTAILFQVMVGADCIIRMMDAENNRLSTSRRESPIEIHHSNTLIRRIGNTTYQIKVYLSETAGETFEDKLLRLVLTDSALHGESEHEAQED